MTSAALPPPDVRVLSVIHPFRRAGDGEGEWWLRVIPQLRERGIDVQILTSADGPAVEHTELVDGVVVHHVPPLKGWPAYAGRMAALLRSLWTTRRHFDLALFHSPNQDAVYASCLIGRALGWKTVYKMTSHGADDLQAVGDSGRLGRLRLASLALADGLISLGAGMASRYADRPSVRDRLLVVSHGVDVHRFAPPGPAQRQVARRTLGIADDRPVAIFCGAMVGREGVDILVESWADVHRQLPDAVLLVVGADHRDGLDDPADRAFAEQVHRRVATLGLQHTVWLLGPRRDVAPLYHAADLCVVPSRAGDSAAVVGEAMASGLPCVVSPLDGVSDELLRDGREGVIVRSEDPREWATYVTELLSAPERTRHMGAQARCRALARVSLDLVLDRYASFFRQTVRRGA